MDNVRKLRKAFNPVVIWLKCKKESDGAIHFPQKLFTLTIEDGHDEGRNIKGEYLYHVRFADDIILITTSREDLNRKFQDINLNINADKTTIMTNANTCNITLKLYKY